MLKVLFAGAGETFHRAFVGKMRHPPFLVNFFKIGGSDFFGG